MLPPVTGEIPVPFVAGKLSQLLAYFLVSPNLSVALPPTTTGLPVIVRFVLRFHV